MTKNKIPPLHPGKVLQEEFMKPLKLSQNKMAQELGVTPQTNKRNCQWKEEHHRRYSYQTFSLFRQLPSVLDGTTNGL